MGLVIVTTQQGNNMSAILIKFFLSVLFAITLTGMLILLYYGFLTILMFTSSVLGLHKTSRFFRNLSVTFSSALLRAYKSIRYKK